ncbi:hypothetical protein [Haladaptatus sp. ZSTT2]|uniref:hypothetical protein n=1 Tax=Haladaptatus sp. ZSTT2 TaxID=3120515 RepID=UPI00300EF1F5
MDDAFSQLVDDTKHATEQESLTPAEYDRLKRAVNGDTLYQLVHATNSYFVLGKYDGGPQERRLMDVTTRLNRRPSAAAFLMKDIPEAWEFWTIKFKICATRATHIVPVLEDSHGGHHWEAGQIDHAPFREKTHILKRTYDTRDEEFAKFSGMIADYIERMQRTERVCEWQTESELSECTDALP